MKTMGVILNNSKISTTMEQVVTVPKFYISSQSSCEVDEIILSGYLVRDLTGNFHPNFDHQI